MLNGKVTIFLLIVGLISEYFPEPHSSERRVKGELICLTMQQKQILKM